VNQPVQFTAPLTAVGQTQNITFSGTGLGSVDVPVTVTPVPTTFFLDPVNGSDSNSGKAAAPWKTFEGVLKAGADPYQSELVPLLLQGENVTIQVVAPAPVTQILSASLNTTVPVPGGSITIVGPTNYKLSIPGGKTLTLNENVKLEGFSIEVNDDNGIIINKSSASINNATIRCKPPAGKTCINVNAANVKLSGNKITFDAKTRAVFIQKPGVIIKDSEFRSDGTSTAGNFTRAIDTTAAGTTVLNSKFDLSSVTFGGLDVTAILFNAGSSSAVVKGNKILVAGAAPTFGVLAVAGTGTGHLAQDNEFKASANGVGIGILGGANFVNDVLNGNSFPKPPSLKFDVQ
jgi:hypothetical protein